MTTISSPSIIGDLPKAGNGDPLTARYLALPVKTRESSTGSHIAAMLAHRDTRRADAYAAEAQIQRARTDREWDRLSEAAMWAGEAWRQADALISEELERLEAALLAVMA
jgi:hypothetical protein